MANPNEDIKSAREIIQKIREEELRGIYRGREGGCACPVPRQLLRIANDEVIPEGPQIQQHIANCPVCRFTLRTLQAGLKSDPSLDPHDDMPEHFTTPLREYLISRRKPNLPPS